MRGQLNQERHTNIYNLGSELMILASLVQTVQSIYCYCSFSTLNVETDSGVETRLYRFWLRPSIIIQLDLDDINCRP